MKTETRGTLEYLIPGEYTVTTTEPPRYGHTASGYGGKIPTPYMLTDTTTRRRTYRVYVMQYSNAGTAYIIRNGKQIIVDTLDLQEATK